MALSFGEDFDGFLVGAPANFHTRLQVATVWPFWVNKELTGTATLTSAKMSAANAAAVAACDAQDGVTDGILGDPRPALRCDGQRLRAAWRAGHAELPDAGRSAGGHMIWDGPRNDRGKRIWFPFARGATPA